jgi:hypothetical protein
LVQWQSGRARHACYTPLTRLLEHVARRLRAAYTPLARLLHASCTPLTRLLHASYTRRARSAAGCAQLCWPSVWGLLGAVGRRRLPLFGRGSKSKPLLLILTKPVRVFSGQLGDGACLY